MSTDDILDDSTVELSGSMAYQIDTPDSKCGDKNLRESETFADSEAVSKQVQLLDALKENESLQCPRIFPSSSSTNMVGKSEDVVGAEDSGQENSEGSTKGSDSICSSRSSCLTLDDMSEDEKADDAAAEPPTMSTSNAGLTGSTAGNSLAALPEEMVSLSQSQLVTLRRIFDGESLFFTGSAGTGKSHVLQTLRSIVAREGKTDQVAFTAPTGIAACNIGGQTVHSWAGIGLGKEDVAVLSAKVRRGAARLAWAKTRLLIIDEISMLSPILFSKLEELARRVRGDRAVFGGLQVVMCGDFFQLPPVGEGSFCFQTEAWQRLLGSPLQADGGGFSLLSCSFRQRDPTFLRMLNELRWGLVSDRTVRCLHAKVRQFESGNAPTALDDARRHQEPTKIFSTNYEVDLVNAQALQRLKGPDVKLEAATTGAKPNQDPFPLVPEVLKLRVGAQVMLTKNLDVRAGLVNGTRGVVIAFEREHIGRWGTLPVVKWAVRVGTSTSEFETTVQPESWTIESNGRIISERTQIPLVLAWAVTVHKCQGMTIPHSEVSFDRIFAYGQAYVALSRATDLAGLRVRDFNPSKIRAHPNVADFYASLGSSLDPDGGRGSRASGESARAQEQELHAPALYPQEDGGGGGGGGGGQDTRSMSIPLSQVISGTRFASKGEFGGVVPRWEAPSCEDEEGWITAAARERPSGHVISATDPMATTTTTTRDQRGSGGAGAFTGRATKALNMQVEMSWKKDRSTAPVPSQGFRTKVLTRDGRRLPPSSQQEHYNEWLEPLVDRQQPYEFLHSRSFAPDTQGGTQKHIQSGSVQTRIQHGSKSKRDILSSSSSASVSAPHKRRGGDSGDDGIEGFSVIGAKEGGGAVVARKEPVPRKHAKKRRIPCYNFRYGICSLGTECRDLHVEAASTTA
jgi:ATP-dependent DNA helicase PIF1